MATWDVAAAVCVLVAAVDSTASVFAEVVAMELDDSASDEDSVRGLQVRARRGAARARTCLRCTPSGIGCATTEETTHTKSRAMNDLKASMVISYR